MSRLTRDGTAEPVSRDQILRHARGQGNINFPCSADHEQDWQPYPVDPYSAICDDDTYIHFSSELQFGALREGGGTREAGSTVTESFTRSGERARFVGLFQGYTGLWTAGCSLARRLHQLKASTTMDLGISIFLIFVRCVASRNLDLLIKTRCWNIICLVCC